MVCGLGWDAVRGDLVGLQSCELRTASAQREQIVALLLSKARPKPMRPCGRCGAFAVLPRCIGSVRLRLGPVASM